MIDVQWKGKIGYGDIVSPICYAYNLSHKLQTPVTLTFRWSGDCREKIHPSDPETLWERAAYIENLCYKGSTDVTIVHRFENPLDVAHTGYDWNIVGSYPLHNYWFPSNPNTRSSNIVVVNSTENNVISLADYGKKWKDPLATQWPRVIHAIQEQGYEVRVVDYRTPVRKLFKLLRVARGFVGYHGTAAWPAKFMHTPSILFSKGGSLTSKSSFCYAYVRGETCEETWPEVVRNLEYYFTQSSIMIDSTRESYKTFMPGKSFLRYLNYGNV